VTRGFALKLAPPETLGRRFQFSLLSVDPGLASVDIERGIAWFNGEGDYVALVEKALKKIVDYMSTRKAPQACRGGIVGGINCCALDAGPRLYTAGGGDVKLFREAGLTKCVYVTRAGKPNPGGSWTHAAVSYAVEVVNARGPLPSPRRYNLPWLAKATLFSHIRGPPGTTERKLGDVDINTLGSTLLGGSLSFLGSWVTGGDPRRDRIEFFLVSEAVSQAYNTLRDVAVYKGYGRSLAAIASRLAREVPVSLEIAVFLALAVKLAQKLGPVSQLSNYEDPLEISSSSLLVTITPQQRPMVRSAMPLSPLLYYSYRPSTLFEVDSIAENVGLLQGRGTAQVSGLRDLLGKCISKMYLQASYPQSEHLADCIRDLASLADHAHSKGNAGLGRRLWRLIDLLTGDVDFIKSLYNP